MATPETFRDRERREVDATKYRRAALGQPVGVARVSGEELAHVLGGRAL